MSSPDDLPAVLAAFEMTLADDLAVGRLLAASDYVARYPGHEAAILRAHTLFVSRYAAEPSAEPIGSGLAPGTRVGPYVLQRELGRGGQGVVFAAEDQRLSRQVAIKFLDRAGLAGDEAVRRFAREAAVVARLEHPNLCALHDVAEHQGMPYLVMRYVEGETLARWLERARRGAGWLALGSTSASSAQRRDAILRVLEATARALHAAHDAGVVHRDFKPGNLMIGPSGEPAVLDFGLALDERSDLGTLTRSGDVLGTPYYMAPEQLVAGRGPVDRRSDVWALGVVLFECLTLRRPFAAPTNAGLFRAILEDALPSSRALGAPQPRDLDVVLATALERDRERRYHSALEFAEDLRRIRAHEPIAARPAGIGLRLRRFAQRRPGVVTSVVLMVLALAAVAGTFGYLAARRPLLELGAVAARTERVEILLSQGYFAIWDGDLRDARAQFAAVLAEVPGQAEALAGLALARARGGEPAQALRELAGELDRGGKLREHAGLRLLLEHLAGAANSAPAPASDAEPTEWFIAGLVTMERARERCERPLAERAVELFTGAILRSKAARAHYHAVRGSAAGFTARRAQLARETATVLEALWPDRPDAAYLAALAWANVDRGRAIATLRRCLARDPGAYRAAKRLPTLLAESGQDAAAVAAAEELVRRWPERAESHVTLGMVHETANRLDRSLAASLVATRLDPTLPVPYLLRVTAQFESGDVAAARATLRECLAVAPNHTMALAQLAMIDADAGEVDAAIALYQDSLRAEPFSPGVWWNLGNQLAAADRLHEALVAQRRAVDLTVGIASPLPPDASELVAALAARVGGLDAQLAAARAGEGVGEASAAALAEAAHYRQDAALAVRLWETALRTLPKGFGVSARTRAALAALALGDAAARSKAEQWLALELDTWQVAVRDGRLTAQQLADRVERWRADPALAAALPPAARVAAR